MKAKLIAIAIIGGAVLLPSCNGCSKKTNMSEENKSALVEPSAVKEIHLKDSLNVVNDAGDVVCEKYSGLLPAASGPGINYDLKLVHYSDLSNGVYELRMTYIEGLGPGKDGVWQNTGRFATFIGIPGEDVARYIKLVPFDKDEDYEMYLIYEDNGDLSMLDTKLNRIKSEHNYTLTRKHKN